MGRLREQAKKYREIEKEHAADLDAPAIADEDGDNEHAEWVQIGMLLECEEIGKPLRHCEDYLNEMSGILEVGRAGEIAGKSPVIALSVILNRQVEPLNGSSSYPTPPQSRDQQGVGSARR